MPNRLAQELASRDKLRTQGINTLPGRKPSQLMSVDQFHRSIPWYEHLLGGLTGQDVALPPGPNDPVLAEVPLSPGDLRSLVNALGKATKKSHPAVVASKKWYHGSGSDKLGPEMLDPRATKSAENLFGPGVYLTDNADDVPRRYAQASASRSKTGLPQNNWSPPINDPWGHVYEARVQPRHILDLDESAPREVREIFHAVADQSKGAPEHLVRTMSGTVKRKIPKKYKNLDALDFEPNATPKQLYAALSDDVYPGFSISPGDKKKADEVFSYVAKQLRKQGYDALTHTGPAGGFSTGRHQVLIMLDPNDYYNIRGKSSLEGPPGISKRPFLPGGEVSSFKSGLYGKEDQWAHIKPSRLDAENWPMFRSK